MKPIWIANTNQGYMVGDYTSTSFTGDGKAHTVFSVAKPPAGGVSTSCYPTNTGCYQRMAQATFDITAIPAQRWASAGTRFATGRAGVSRTPRTIRRRTSSLPRGLY